MDTALDSIIVKYQDKVQALEKQLVDAKRMVNQLCEDDGRPPVYVVESESAPALATIKPDSFYGVPLATAVTSYLRMRKASNAGPASIDDIHDALKRGGYLFDAKNADYAKRGLRNSINKNTATFHRLPTDVYGLREWYPNIPKARAKPESTVEQDSFLDEMDADVADDPATPVAAVATATVEAAAKPNEAAAKPNGKRENKKPAAATAERSDIKPA